MPTQFTATVKPSGGDYTSLNNAVTGLANNITLATIKVFSISAYSTPTIAAGDTVLGQTSGATGVCVLVNISRTQILIKTIAVASFLNTEIVQKTADPSTNVTLSNNGDSPIIGIECYSMSDTTAVSITGYTTSATNYIYIYTLSTERHRGKWDDTKYKLEIVDSDVIVIAEEFVRIEGLQLYTYNPTINNRLPIFINLTTATGGDIRINSNIIKGHNDTIYSQIGIGYSNATMNPTIKCWNNIIYNFYHLVGGNSIFFQQAPNATAYLYNNTFIRGYRCIYNVSGTCVAKNNICQDAGLITFDGTFVVTSTNNITDIASGGAFGAQADSGTTDGTSAGKLIDSTQNFLTTVKIGMIIKNTTDTTYTYVTAVDSDFQLSVNNDIFISGETYIIYTNKFGNISFVDSTNFDFHLTPSDTIARNYGTDLNPDPDGYLSFSDDIDGQTRPGQLIWDVGADEYFPIKSYGVIIG